MHNAASCTPVQSLQMYWISAETTSSKPKNSKAFGQNISDEMSVLFISMVNQRFHGPEKDIIKGSLHCGYNRRGAQTDRV